MSGPPVVLTNTLGRPVTNIISERGAVPMTVVNTLGEPVTLVNSGGEPVTLFNPNGTLWDYPFSLFSNNEQGAWYDPSDFSTLYQNSTGTTPVTAVEQPVGLMLDRSKGLVLGSELVSNGDFSGGTTGWIVLGAGTQLNSAFVVSGALQVSTTTEQNCATAVAVAAGKSIQIRFRARRVGATAVTCLVRASGNFGASSVDVHSFGNIGTDWADYVCVFTNLAAATTRLTFREGSGSGGLYEIDDVSAKDLPGNHALQATSASRPVLRATNRLDFDGADDRIAAAAGGGGTTGMLFVAGINLDAVGAASTIWSDTGTNTGYRVRINASNQVEVSAGNGAAYTTAATSETLASGTNYVIAAWHDGTNLNARLGLSGAIAQAAFATATAGTAAFTLGMDNGATSSFLNGKLYNAVYVRNFAGTLSDVNATASYVSGKMA